METDYTCPVNIDETAQTYIYRSFFKATVPMVNGKVRKRNIS